MTETDFSYNGWKNYETWVTNLWLTNEEWSYQAVVEQAAVTTDNYELAEWIKVFTEGAMCWNAPETGLAADLFQAALSEVDWVEIAEAFKEE